MIVKKGAAVRIRNAKGQYLLLQRSATAKHHRLKWEGVGGHLEAGESFKQAAVRETFEEVGIVLKEDDLELGFEKVFEDDERPFRYHVQVFLAKSDQEPELKEPDTFAQFVWAAKAEIKNLDLAPYVIDDFKHFGLIE